MIVIRYTIVEVKEIPGVKFNALAFSPCEETPNDIQDLLDEYGSDLENDIIESKRH